MSEIKINKEELLEAIFKRDLERTVIEKLIPNMSDDEITNFINRLRNFSDIRQTLEILKKQGRLRNIVPMIWNNHIILDSFSSVLEDFTEEFKPYILDAIKALRKVPYGQSSTFETIKTSLLLMMKVDGLDETPEFKNFIKKLEIYSPIYALIILSAHKLYGILSSSELKEVLDRTYKILKWKSITYYDKDIVKKLIEIFLEFKKIERPEMMKKILSINEKLENEDI